jgi:hypothetical protein
MPSRNRRRWPPSATIDVVHEDERIERKSIPADEFPRVLVLLKLSMPEIFSGGKVGPPEAWILYNKEDAEQARRYGGKGFTAAHFDIAIFCRMLAKIAHAYAVAECGPNQFARVDPLLPDFILKGLGSPLLYVGGEAANPESEAFMYRIGCFHHAIGGRKYLGVFLRLYAFIEGAPLYQVAVADITNN